MSLDVSPILIITKLSKGAILTICPFFPIPANLSAGEAGA